LNKRLLDAVDHLESTRLQLSSREQALRTFSLRLGASRALPSAANSAKPVSLLQISAEGNDIPGLPAVKKVLEKPIDVMKTMTSDVQALQQRLVEVQGSNEHSVEIQKREYEDTLDDQEKNNHKLEKQNNLLALDIKALRSSNRDLRSQAQQLQAKNVALQSRVSNLMENMTMAQEVTAKALDNAEQSLHNSSELEVLIELGSDDQARDDENLHKNRLQEVARGDELAMLQVTSGPGHSAEELLVMMTDSLTDLAAEQNASSTSLKHAFEEESRKNDARKQQLLDKMAELNATQSAQWKLNVRLNIAVSHLDKLHDKLTKQSKALQSFLFAAGGGNEDRAEKDNVKTTEKASQKNKDKSNSEQAARSQKNHTTQDVEMAPAQEKSSVMSWLLR